MIRFGAFVIAFTAASAVVAFPSRTAPAAPGDAPSGRMDFRESFVERIRREGPGREGGFLLEQRRSTVVDLRLTGAAPGAVAADTPVALRVGALVIETTPGVDPAWTPGRRSFRVRPLEEDPAAELAVRWTSRGVTFRLRTSGDTVIGEPGDGEPAGDIARAFDAAASLGGASWFLRTEAAGRLRRGELRLLDEVLPLRDARISGRGRVVPPETDPVAPTVEVETPASGLLSTQSTTVVTGSVLDDRTVDRVTWSLDGGEAQEIELLGDPTLNPVRGQRVTFGFDLAIPAPGIHTLRITAYDPGGSATVEEVTFAYVVPVNLPLATGGQGVVGSVAVVDGEVFTWGDDLYRLLGNGDAGPAVQEEPTAIGLTGVRDVSVGRLHALALIEDGTIVGWGGNNAGQIGNGTTQASSSPTAVSVIDDAVAVSAGYDYSLALRSDGTVWGWGFNLYRQLGTGVSATTSTVPVRVEGLSNVVALDTGSFQSVALLADGTVRCWGYQSLGGTPSEPGAMVQVLLPSGDPLADVVEVAAGYGHFLARRGDGTVVTWGTGTQGSLGIPGVAATSAALALPGVAGAVSIAAGFNNGFAVLADGTLLGWGSNAQGVMAESLQATVRTFPAPVSGVSDAVRVHVGPMSHQVLVQLRTNVVLGWGYYTFGVPRPVPPPVTAPVQIPLPPVFGD